MRWKPSVRQGETVKKEHCKACAPYGSSFLPHCSISSGGFNRNLAVMSSHDISLRGLWGRKFDEKWECRLSLSQREWSTEFLTSYLSDSLSAFPSDAIFEIPAFSCLSHLSWMVLIQPRPTFFHPDHKTLFLTPTHICSKILCIHTL